MLLMQRDKLFHGNCSSNVKADSLLFFFSTQMETLLLALREWIVIVIVWLYSTEFHQMLGTVVFLCRRRLAAEQNVLVAHYCFFFFPQEKHQLSVSSIVCGIIRHNGLPELESNFHLQCGFEGTSIYHHQHPEDSAAHSHITLIRILWEVIPLTLPLKEVHCRHGRGKTNHIYYLC